MGTITANSDEFLRAIGTAVQAYGEVEASQSRLLQCILGVTITQAQTVFFTVQNVRGRNELFHSLLAHKYGDKHKKYWESCGRFLHTLSIFRNAIVHWHSLTIVYVNRTGDKTKAPKSPEPAIRNPMPGRSGKTLRLDDFGPFIVDCGYIRAELDQFSGFLRQDDPDDDPTLHERFSRPLPRQNRACSSTNPAVQSAAVPASIIRGVTSI